MHTSQPRAYTLAFLSLLMLGACSSAGDDAKGNAFESDVPKSAAQNGRGANGAADDAEGTSGGAPAPGAATPGEADGADSAARAIVEADIVQLAGDTLYALSRIGGLSVIDARDPAQLKLLGRYRRLSGDPFEMYLADGVIFAMFSSWGEYVQDGDAYQFVQVSKLVALDVRDPAAISELGSFDVPGAVSDSRSVGKVLYVVGHENGYCWGCMDQAPRTTLVSIDVSDPRAPRKVDELAFADPKDSWSWQRSISVTDKRVYVAGPEYSSSMPMGSTIQVIDISDPTGDLVEGATVRVAGQVSSRWQMDEYEGVLRVISQPVAWQSRTPPSVQTFRVNSSSSVTPLASLQLKVPDNRETLRSARFDGTRAYAITAIQQDPLFTIDLSDPAQPRQMGELHMPGFVYHMEPRGDRVIGLGYDQGNPQGAITVSVFDVSDLAAPKQLSRANFGGDWASLPEDQDRIHKAFRILPELGLVMVPFSGWSERRAGPIERCPSSGHSGVQLLDLNGDTLSLRGTALTQGQARRALIHRDHLLTVSDARVDAFDIRDRAAPRQVGGAALARSVSKIVPLANQLVARVNSSYWSDAPWIDFVGADDVGQPQISLGELSLQEALEGNSRCAAYTYIEAAFGHDAQVEVLYRRYEDSSSGDESKTFAGVAVIDATDPSAPAVVGKVEWSMSAGRNASSYEWYTNWYDGVSTYNPNTVSFVRAGDALVALESSYEWSNDNGGTSRTRVRLRSVDLTDPAKPTTRVTDLGDRAYTGMVSSGDEVMLGYFEQGSKSGRVRFYVQPVDVGDPSAVSLGKSINVPGIALHYDAAHARLVNSQLTRVDAGKLTARECDERFGHFEFDYPDQWDYSSDREPLGTCTGFRQSLHLVRLDGGQATLEDTLELEQERVVANSSAGDDRVTAVLSSRYSFYGWGPAIAEDGCYGCGGRSAVKAEPVEVLTLSGFASGRFASGRLRVEQSPSPWWGFWGNLAVHAQGKSALLAGATDLSLVQLDDVSAPELTRNEPLYGYISAVAFQDGSAFLALGEAGAERISLR